MRELLGMNFGTNEGMIRLGIGLDSTALGRCQAFPILTADMHFNIRIFVPESHAAGAEPQKGDSSIGYLLSACMMKQQKAHCGHWWDSMVVMATF